MEKTKESKNITVLAILFLLSVYGAPAIAVGLTSLVEKIPSFLSKMLFGLPVCVAAVSIFYMKQHWEEINRTVLLRCAVLVKYLMIPFFVGGVLICLMFLLLMFTPLVFMVFAAPVAILYILGIGWLYMVCGSAFSVAYGLKARREGVHGEVFGVLVIISQFFFVVDVIATMILTLKEKKYITATIITVLLCILGGVAGIAWLILQFIG
jgi:hypothetical protein